MFVERCLHVSFPLTLYVRSASVANEPEKSEAPQPPPEELIAEAVEAGCAWNFEPEWRLPLKRGHQSADAPCQKEGKTGDIEWNHLTLVQVGSVGVHHDYQLFQSSIN